MLQLDTTNRCYYQILLKNTTNWCCCAIILLDSTFRCVSVGLCVHVCVCVLRCVCRGGVCVLYICVYTQYLVCYVYPVSHSIHCVYLFCLCLFFVDVICLLCANVVSAREHVRIFVYFNWHIIARFIFRSVLWRMLCWIGWNSTHSHWLFPFLVVMRDLYV